MKTLVILQFMFLSFWGSAQPSWGIYSDNTIFPHYIFSNVEVLLNNHVLAVGTTRESLTKRSPSLWKLNAAGEIVQERRLDYSSLAVGDQILYHNGFRVIDLQDQSYLVLSGLTTTKGDSTTFIFQRIDEELNDTQDYFTYKIPKESGRVYPLLLEESFILNIHMKHGSPQGGAADVYAYTLIEFDFEGNILKEKIHEVSFGGLAPFSIQERLDSTGYIGMGNANKVYFYDEAFNYTRFYESDFWRASANANVFEKYNDSLFLLSSDIVDGGFGHLSRTQLALTLVDKHGDLYDQVIYADENDNYSTVATNSLSPLNGNFYVMGIEVHFGLPLNDRIVIASIDSSFHINWVSILERENGYNAYSIAASPDGGIVITGGQIHADAVNTAHIENFIIKLNDMGQLLTNTHGFKQARLVTYPNPTSDILKIALGDNVCEDCAVVIHSIEGSKVLYSEEKSDNLFEIDVSGLRTGSYTYQVRSGQQVVASGQWVKM